MSGVPSSRRGFLSGLASLPLIGGSVTLIGAPSASAEALTPALLDSYDAWLFFERRYLQHERQLHPIDPNGVMNAPYKSRGVSYDFVPHGNAGARFHWGDSIDDASRRAAIVLSAVGCDWRGKR